MEVAFLYLIGAVLSSGTAIVLLRIGVLRVGVSQARFLRSLSQTILVLLVIFFLFGKTGFSFPHRVEIIYPILNALMGGIAFVALSKALMSIEASIARPIISLNFMITVVLGILVLGESLTLEKGVGVTVALIAIILLSTRPRFRIRRPQ